MSPQEQLQQTENEIRSAMMIGFVGNDGYVDQLLTQHAQAAVAVAAQAHARCTATGCANAAYIDVAPEGTSQEVLVCSTCFNDLFLKALDATSTRVITA